MRIWQRIKLKIEKARFQRRLNIAELVFPVPCKLYGVKDPEYQGALVQSRAGDKLQLVHIPSEEYPSRVYAYSVTLNRILGYLHTELSNRLIYVFGKGLCRDGEIVVITGDYRRTLGCNIRIYDTAEEFKNQTDFSHLHGN